MPAISSAGPNPCRVLNLEGSPLSQEVAQEAKLLVAVPGEASQPLLTDRAVELYFRQLYGLPQDQAAWPEAFAALAPRCPVFRVDPAPAPRGRTDQSPG